MKTEQSQGHPELKKSVKIEFDRAVCNGCGICAEFCARKVLSLDDAGKPQVVQAERCAVCRMCEILCPETAILVQ